MAWEPNCFFSALHIYMCRHIYNWNIVDIDVKQPIYPISLHRLKPMKENIFLIVFIKLGKKV